MLIYYPSNTLLCFFNLCSCMSRLQMISISFCYYYVCFYLFIFCTMKTNRKMISATAAKVEDMEVGITLGLENQEGSLKLVVKDYGCYIKDISIKLDGGASWLYQGYGHIYSFFFFNFILEIMPVVICFLLIQCT